MAVGRYGHFAKAIWLHAGHTLLIAAVGLRLILITPHLERGDHLRERQLSAVLLISTSVLAIAFIGGRRYGRLSRISPRRCCTWRRRTGVAG
jgi:hypothetical protein